MTPIRTLFPAARANRALLACVGVCIAALMAGGLRADAAGNSGWQAIQIAAAPDGTSRVLFTGQTSQGEIVSIWKLDPTGNFAAASQIYGPYTDANGNPWVADSLTVDMEVASDGTTRLLWTASGQAGNSASVWKFDSKLNKIGSGPAYGPYAGWVPSQFLVAADGSMRLLWTEVGGSGGILASVWNIDSNGNASATGAAYGPYNDNRGYSWTPLQLAVAPDGTSRLLWVSDPPNGDTGEEVSFWTLNSAGNVTQYGNTFGPYNQWSVDGFDITPNDNKLHLLWYNDADPGGDVASAWTLDTFGKTSAPGPAYGPYSGWFAYDILAGNDGTAQIKWDQLDDKGNTTSISLWSLDLANREANYGPTYGPYTGYILYDYERSPITNAYRLLWLRNDNAISSWSLNPSGTATAKGPAYGPFALPQ